MPSRAFRAIIALLAGFTCAAQTDSGSHSCTAELGGGYDLIRGGDGGYLGGVADFQGGGGFLVHRNIALTFNFMYDAAYVKKSALDTSTAPGATTAGVPSAKAHYYTVTFDPTYRTKLRGPVELYALGGFGWLRRSAEFTGPAPNPVIYPGDFPTPGIGASSTANTGVWDAGGGLDISLPRTQIKFFAEARFVKGLAFNSHTRIVPIVFGFRW